MTARQTFRRAAVVVARAERLPVATVLDPVGFRARRARHLAVYLAVVCGGVRLLQLARMLGARRWWLRAKIGEIEDAREDAEFDAALERLEAAFGVRRQLPASGVKLASAAVARCHVQRVRRDVLGRGTRARQEAIHA